MSLDTGLMKDYFNILRDLCAVHNYFYNYHSKINWRGDLVSINIEFHKRNPMVQPIFSMSSTGTLYEIDDNIYDDSPSVTISGEYIGTLYDLIEDTRNFFSRSLKIYEDEYTKRMWEELLMKKFTRDDLRSGDFVQIRDGRYGVVVRDIYAIVFPNGTYVDMRCYSSDLKEVGGKELDIMEVYRGCKCFNHCNTYSGKTVVYDRSKVDDIEEMTMEEVCKALGKNIKIVKG